MQSHIVLSQAVREELSKKHNLFSVAMASDTSSSKMVEVGEERDSEANPLSICGKCSQKTKIR